MKYFKNNKALSADGFITTLINYLKIKPLAISDAGSLYRAYVSSLFAFLRKGYKFGTVGFLLKRPINVTIDSVYFRVRPYSDDLGYIINNLKRFVWDWINVNQNSVIVDVGSNIGGFSIKLAKKVNKVISIEPNPSTFQALMQNISLNRLHNIYPLNLALSDCQGKRNLYTSNKNFGLSSLFQDWDQNKDNLTNILVDVSTLDIIISNYDLKKIDYLLIDAEGSELNIIKGATQALGLTENIVIEVSYGQISNAVKDIINKNGFEIVDRHMQSNKNEYWFAKKMRGNESDSH